MTNTNITIDDVMEKVNAEYYRDDVQRKKPLFKEGHVFDENESVVWNREKVEIENTFIKAINLGIIKNSNTGQKRFEDDLSQAIVNGTALNLTQAGFIYSKAWEEGHSDGYYSVVQEADELMDLINDIEKTK